MSQTILILKRINIVCDMVKNRGHRIKTADMKMTSLVISKKILYL